ncbi:MAG: C-terminal helicase domain-containing protein, partial [Planctomycetia bacterium]|nr:C-terminal helicase domain-containing protein [Planctomycetia bacterium]
QALQHLAESSEDGNATQRVRVLAELMKLRRLCCHPQLVLPDWNANCSKLDLLDETVSDLLDNNHKALIFSQFTDHLKLIAERMDKQGVSYQYLDGSMTQKKRQEAVDAFQAGSGDVFLISLKAGGFGLNLTAADYVIHMDPWWNPAVENQASDRVHRIGQKRPVTIYRMITKGTIEEKIVDLHQRKEQLARDILEETGSPTKVSLDELMALLREE